MGVATKIGLIARADRRGIAYQTHEFFKAMRPAKTLVVDMMDEAFPVDRGLFIGDENVVYVPSDMRTRALPEKKVREFLDGLDVVFAVETVYDWRLIHWAHGMGVAVMVQGNPEMTRHHFDGSIPHPHQWAWPTRWMRASPSLPDGIDLPVPTPQTPAGAGAGTAFDEGPLRVLHPAGKQAVGDRNGTQTVLASLESIRENVHLTIVSQDGLLEPETRKVGKNLTVEVKPAAADRWEMYEGQHVVVIPRRYGGLCLPILEGVASGCTTIMPDSPPNDMWPGIRVPSRPSRDQRTPFGPVQTRSVHHTFIAESIDRLARDRDLLCYEMIEAEDWAAANSWDLLGPGLYKPALDNLRLA